jgi:hypothetical protein
MIPIHLFLPCPSVKLEAQIWMAFNVCKHFCLSELHNLYNSMFIRISYDSGPLAFVDFGICVLALSAELFSHSSWEFVRS